MKGELHDIVINVVKMNSQDRQENEEGSAGWSRKSQLMTH